jgi:DNA topoisomerase-2
MILVNGAKGIATGFSTDIPNYNPIDLSLYLLNKLTDSEQTEKLVPWYLRFEGTNEIVEKDGKKYLQSQGCYTEIKPYKFQVTELPIGLWTDDFKLFIEELTQESVQGKKKIPQIVEYIKPKSNDNNKINFIIKVLEDKKDFFEDLLVNKLFSYTSLNNMYALDPHGLPKRYESAEEIVDEFYKIRLEIYKQRYNFLYERLENEISKLENEYKYLEYVNKGTIIVKESEAVIIKKMETLGLMKINDSYDYLLGMKISSLNKEKMLKLKKELDEKNKELEKFSLINEKDLWRIDLINFNTAYEKFIEDLIKQEETENLKSVVEKPKTSNRTRSAKKK